MEKFRILAKGFLLSLGMSFGFAIFLIAQAAFTSGLSVSDKSSTGSTLSSASWNRLVDAVLELDTRTLNLASSKQNSLPSGTAGQVLKWNGSAWVAGTDSTASIGQANCEWIYVSTCGHSCGQ